MTPAWTGRWQDGLRYGGLGFPLAFVALPLYVVLPNHYASEYGVPLAWLGLLLLGARLLDAVADPLIGRWADTLLGRPSGHAAWWTAAIASVVLALGFRGLFFPPEGLGPIALMGWCAALLTATYLAYSVIGIVHQAWGARLGGGEAQRARIVAWREGLALSGVLVASVLPSAAGLPATTLAFALALAAAIALLRFAPRTRPAAQEHPAIAPANPFHSPAFRGLLGVYLLNGIASAIPATLVLFFIRDRLQAPAHEALFLGSYFAAAALSIPVWLRAVGRLGLARTWRVAMLLSIAVFGWAATLGAGDVAAYTAVCLLSGVALGADLIVPAALLAGVIQGAGHGGRAEGAYVGWWNFATKLNLALAAGLSLPLLQAFGYAPGERGGPALSALAVAYCLLPCLLKLTAAVLLGRFQQRHPDTSVLSP
jgi:GPH family glycoside/pentoside/hexuronide:cation symporter